MAHEKTIREAQAELADIQHAIGKMLTEFEHKYEVEFAYTAFVDHNNNMANIRLQAKL